jgi:PAS domain S-box-containing protein
LNFFHHQTIFFELSISLGYRRSFMTMNYVYTPQIWPSVLMALLMVILAGYSGRRRNVPGATSLMIASLLAAAWAVGSLLEAAALDPGTKIFWFKFQAATQVPIAIAITCFILEYAWPGRWLTRRNLALLAFPGLLAIVMILTDDLHHLIWHSFSFANGSVKPQFGLGSWFLLAYSFGVLELVNLIVLGWLFWRSPQHRWPVVLMLVGQLAGRMIFLLDRANLVPSLLPFDLLGMSLEFLMYAIALFGFSIFDPIPLARRTAIMQLHSGMLVLDTQGEIVSLNPAAAAILGSPAKRLLGRSIQELLPAGFELVGDLQDTVETEISLGNGAEIRSYQLEASALNDWRGLAVGRLLLLHDITGQKHAQAQLVEHQRALAILHEREQLARELHDSLGQVLGYTTFRLEATRKLIADGKLSTADDQLVKMEHIVADAHADVREYILNLRTAPTDRQPFFSALQHYLDGFLKNYDIQVDLSVGAGVEDTIFSPDTQMQLFRIIQEAFSNARKHAQTDCVRLSFEMADSLVRIRIQDNGRGFDPTQTAGEGHFGLRFMRERAESLGGRLQVDSTPGEGTCIEVGIPVIRKQ